MLLLWSVNVTIKFTLVGSIFTTGRNDREGLQMYFRTTVNIYIVFTQRERPRG